jgi:SAM (Sterile alpha motif) domain-containing protein
MDVAEWLRKLRLEQREPAFRENKIGADLLPNLTAENLKDLGVALVGDSRRLLAAIAALQPVPAVDTPASPRPSAASTTSWASLQPAPPILAKSGRRQARSHRL